MAMKNSNGNNNNQIGGLENTKVSTISYHYHIYGNLDPRDIDKPPPKKRVCRRAQVDNDYHNQPISTNNIHQSSLQNQLSIIEQLLSKDGIQLRFYSR